MKHCLLLVALCCSTMLTFAQQDTTHRPGARPGFEFSLSAGPTIPVGWNIQWEATVYPWKHWGLTGVAGHSVNRDASYANQDYSSFRFFMGPTYRVALGGALSLKASIVAGPAVNQIPYHKGGAPASAEGLLELHYTLGRRMYLLVSTDYFLSSYANNYIEKFGTQYFNATNWTPQRVFETNLGVGIRL